jgi:capsular exopolysaccharide synthesis family protein
VGTLPSFDERPGRLRSVSEAEWKDFMVESIDSARTSLLHASRVTSHRVVMICSAVSGEGKTTLSCHMASSLARAGRRTLLIDCDLRRPSIHKMMDIPMAPGVCEILRGEVKTEDTIVAVDPDLWVIPAGRCDLAALRALSQEPTRALFERVKAEFDFILVDSSPVLAVADSMQVCQYVDATLFSILHSVSCSPKVIAAYERLAGLEIPILGAIVTGVNDPLLATEYRYVQPEG